MFFLERECVFVHENVYVRSCMRTCVCVCVRVCPRVCLRVYVMPSFLWQSGIRGISSTCTK